MDSVRRLPGLVYAAGAIGFFPFVYTVVLCPVLFVVLPRLWTAAREVDAVTVADWVRSRYDSPALMLAIALTGVLATMPYIALQLLGVRAVLIAGGLYPRGLAGDLALTVVFAVLAVATYRSGLRAPTVISLLKGALVFGATRQRQWQGAPGHVRPRRSRSLPRRAHPGWSHAAAEPAAGRHAVDHLLRAAGEIRAALRRGQDPPAVLEVIGRKGG